jgi:hypothetical protein
VPRPTRTRHCRFAGYKQIYRQINALTFAMAPCRTRTRGDVVKAAAAERIVAFGRPGKSPKIPF